MDLEQIELQTSSSEINSSTTIQDLPITIFHRILSFLPSTKQDKDQLSLRLVSSYWNTALSNTGGKKLIFTFDGKFQDNDENHMFTNIVLYFIRSGLQDVPHSWKVLRLRNASFFQLYAWMQEITIGHVKVVEFKNCNLQMDALIEFLSQFTNMESFSYRRDPEKMDLNKDSNNDPYLEKSEDYYQHLENLKSLSLCTGLETEITILNFFNFFCNSIENLSLKIENSTRDSKSGAWSSENLLNLLKSIGTTLQRNQRSLKTLHLVFETTNIMSKDRLVDRLFFAIHELQWNKFEFPHLETVRIRYPAEEITSLGNDRYFLPFVRHLIGGRALRTLEIGTISISQANTYDRLITQLNNMKTQLNPTLSIKLGIFLQYDSSERFDNDHILGESLSSMVIESSVRASRIGRVLSRSIAPNLQCLSILNRTSSLTDYGLHTISNNYSRLTILVVDELTVSSSGAPAACQAKIVDAEMQGIFQELVKLETLKLSANMDEVSDSGLTGIRKSICELYSGSSSISKNVQIFLAQEPKSYSISCLKALRHLHLRGVGERVTNLTTFYGMNNMKALRECTIIGKHKISEFGVSYLKSKAGVPSTIKIKTSEDSSASLPINID